MELRLPKLRQGAPRRDRRLARQSSIAVSGDGKPIGRLLMLHRTFARNWRLAPALASERSEGFSPVVQRAV